VKQFAVNQKKTIWSPPANTYVQNNCNPGFFTTDYLCDLCMPGKNFGAYSLTMIEKKKKYSRIKKSGISPGFCSP